MLIFNSLAGTTVLSETSHKENAVSSFLYLSLVNRRSRWLVLMFVSSRFRPSVFQFTSYVRYEKLLCENSTGTLRKLGSMRESKDDDIFLPMLRLRIMRTHQRYLNVNARAHFVILLSFMTSLQ